VIAAVRTRAVVLSVETPGRITRSAPISICASAGLATQSIEIAASAAEKLKALRLITAGGVGRGSAVGLPSEKSTSARLGGGDGDGQSAGDGHFRDTQPTEPRSVVIKKY
jgi:hypothetical protein